MAEEASASPLASVLDSPTSREEDGEDSDLVSRGEGDPDVCPVARQFRAGLVTPIPADTARRLARSSAALSASISWSKADLPVETAKRGLIEGAIMAHTHGTTSLAERTQPQGRSTESLYYLIANRWQESRPTDKQGLYLLSPSFSIFVLKQRIAAPLTLV